ncbi:MAG: PIN domain-containing protein [Deltaproteobacteria bacterium]|nr:PIN domain-containing protein [Deltaproteobacteria bacterium]
MKFRTLVIDTSVYINFFRGKNTIGSVLDSEKMTVYCTSVIIAELLAGAFSTKEREVILKMRQHFKNDLRLVTPTEEDWFWCGYTLSQIGKKHGFEQIKKSRLINDCLIALACKNLGATLLTENNKDFGLIRRFIDFQCISV